MKDKQHKNVTLWFLQDIAVEITKNKNTKNFMKTSCLNFQEDIQKEVVEKMSRLPKLGTRIAMAQTREQTGTVMQHFKKGVEIGFQ